MVRRWEMGIAEQQELHLAAVAAVAGAQVEVFIAVAELGLTTVQMVDLLVLPGLMHITALLLVIGLMPSPTHCYACAMGLHQHRALFHLPPNMLAIMVGLDAVVADSGSQVHIPAATAD